MKIIDIVKNNVRSFLDCNSLSKVGRLLFKSVLCGFVVCFATSMTGFDAQSKEISNDIFRLHILANSDSEKDQDLKHSVRKVVQELCYNVYDGAKDRDDAERIIGEKLPEIIDAAQEEVYRQGFDYTVNGEIVKNMYFTNRVYDNITLPAGDYDALRITIGSGEGHNWWCVMFPPICISAADNDADISDVLDETQTELVTDKRYEIKFKVYEWYQDLMEKI